MLKGQASAPRGMFALAAAVAFAFTASSLADSRQVQLREINTATDVVTLFNFAATDEPLDGFRLCTADDDQMFQYSSPGGFDGRTIEAGTEFHIHWSNDAPPADPDAINIEDLGGLIAGPLDNGPFGLALYGPTVVFGPDDMADYLQWTNDLDDPANETADARAPTAVAAGLWTAVDAWVVTADDTERILLLDDSGGTLHGPDDYAVAPEGDDCVADIDGDETVGFSDLLAILSTWGDCPDCPEDLDEDGSVGFSDLLTLLAAWGPCP